MRRRSLERGQGDTRHGDARNGDGGHHRALDGPLDGFVSGAAALGAASDVSLCSVVARAAARICSARLGPADRRPVTSEGPPSGCAIDDMGSVAASATSPWSTSAGATTAVVVSVAAATTPPATATRSPRSGRASTPSRRWSPAWSSGRGRHERRRAQALVELRQAIVPDTAPRALVEVPLQIAAAAPAGVAADEVDELAFDLHALRRPRRLVERQVEVAGEVGQPSASRARAARARDRLRASSRRCGRCRRATDPRPRCATSTSRARRRERAEGGAEDARRPHARRTGRRRVRRRGRPSEPCSSAGGWRGTPRDGRC